MCAGGGRGCARAGGLTRESLRFCRITAQAFEIANESQITPLNTLRFYLQSGRVAPQRKANHMLDVPLKAYIYALSPTQTEGEQC